MRRRAPKRASGQAAARADVWTRHDAELRDPEDVAAQWQPASALDPSLLTFRVRGSWWEALAATGQTLLVSREYEHLVVALRARGNERRVSVLRLPHPSGIAVDPRRGRVYIASTRNPNIVFELEPASRFLGSSASSRSAPDRSRTSSSSSPTSAPDRLKTALLPARCRYLPGCLYLHDLAVLGGRLYATAVALNAIVELPETGGFRTAWWPSCIDGSRGPSHRRSPAPRFDRNYLQLNSIAAGPNLRASFFAASAAAPSNRRPGHLNFPVDGRGVIFSGRTRDVVATGLTRPHSVRFIDEELWVANSGYGEIGRVEAGRYEPAVRLPGWTRGLAHHRGVAFVGSSRVLPRFSHYAPGVDLQRSEAGVHAVDLASGKVIGSLIWPAGNQIFAIELTGRLRTIGFPYEVRGGRQTARVRQFFFRGSPS